MVTIKTSEQIYHSVNDGVEEQRSWALVEEQKKALKDYRNPYPKDLFVWNNKEKLDFDRGRFNKFTHKLVENIREDLRKILFGDE